MISSDKKVDGEDFSSVTPIWSNGGLNLCRFITPKNVVSLDIKPVV